MWQTVPEEKRRGSPPPFILVIEATINTIKPKVIEVYREDDRIRTDFIAYDNILSNLNPTDRAERLLEDWRFCRYRTTYKQQRALAEFGLSATCTNEAKQCLKAILKILAKIYDGTMRHGVAPKDAIEQRIGHCMKKIGACR